MSKTAEEILREVYSPSEPYSSAVIAMEDFAAQEVEAYRERLKNLISQQVASNQSSHLLTESQIHGLIDMLK